MHCENMMLRFRLTIFFAISFLVSFAQGNDTSVFFRYAATFDQLITDQYYPAGGVIPDTSALELLNAAPVNCVVLKEVGRTTYASDRVLTENLGSYKYSWDREGRVSGYREYHAGDSIAHLSIRFQYLIRQSMDRVIISNGANVDTTMYQYNRSGWVGTWKRHVLRVDTNYQIQGTRMYDSRGKLVVATNVFYGPLSGTFTFDYDKDGRLTRRSFLPGGTGVVLCTDTVEYAFQSESKSIVVMTHKLKVAGMEKWQTLESRTMYPYSNVILSYSDFNDADTNYFYRNLNSYTVNYEYDNRGRVLSESFGNEIEPTMIVAKYYYGKQFQPDSIVFTERFIQRKQIVTRVYSRDIREYDEKGRISVRSVTTYLFDEMKKKDKVVPKEEVKITYTWKSN